MKPPCTATIRDAVVASRVARPSPPARTIFEFWVPGNERADVAFVGDLMEGVEIKAGRDTLKRLPRQMAAYARVFERCQLVLAERHVTAALEILPTWWGVSVSDDVADLQEVRASQPNPAPDPGTLVRLLWRDEAFRAASQFEPGLDARATRVRLWDVLLHRLGPDELHDTVRRALLARTAASARIPSQQFAVV